MKIWDYKLSKSLRKSKILYVLKLWTSSTGLKQWESDSTVVMTVVDALEKELELIIHIHTQAEIIF